jgi:thioredoxin-dependent peroxiredoxin
VRTTRRHRPRRAGTVQRPVVPPWGEMRSHLTASHPPAGQADVVAGTLSPMEKGDLAPDFELPDEEGTPRKLSDLAADGPVVLFFYPAAMTPGCTAESCHFRDLKAEFDAVGARRVGISADQVEKQKRFSDKHSFDYPLLSDPDGAVATQFGVRRRFTMLTPTKRSTFLIAPDLRVIDVIRSEVRMNLHADRALEALRSYSPA